MIGIGDTFPDFEVQYVIGEQVKSLSRSDFKGNWTILFFYPEDFSFICPTEVTGFNDQKNILDSNNVDIYGTSVDNLETHKKWIAELGLTYPLISDENGSLSKKLGVLDDDDNRANRATFVINPDLQVEFVMVTSRNVGRSVKETIRVMGALQSGKQCPVDYDPLSFKESN
ncbi:MAG: redoxin domain-containing protein [Candidatus Kariarchaeaceae archaeon]|jgi:alkyl hydroperoxide reductase subunit AhpC